MTGTNRIVWIALAAQSVLCVAALLAWWFASPPAGGGGPSGDPAGVDESLRRFEQRLAALERRLASPTPRRSPLPDTDGSPVELGGSIEARITALERRLAGVDATRRTAELRQRMSSAIQRGDRDAVRRLLARGSDPEAPGADGEIPLVEAARAGGVELVRSLLQAGASIDRPGVEGRTALIVALSVDHTDVALDLIDRGADIGVVDKTGETAMVWAAWRGNTAAVRRLIAAGADPNETANGNPPIAYAISRGHLEVVRYLVSRGADVNLADVKGVAPLANARKHGEAAIVAFLTGCGAR